MTDNESRFNGAGGTPGGIGQFVMGVLMAALGAYLLTSRVTVAGSYWSWWGYSGFGLSLLPLIFGVGILFYRGDSITGWLLLIVGVVIILANILMNMHLYFEQTSLFNTILMLVLLAGGIGLVVRSLRAVGE